MTTKTIKASASGRTLELFEDRLRITPRFARGRDQVILLRAIASMKFVPASIVHTGTLTLTIAGGENEEISFGVLDNSDMKQLKTALEKRLWG